MFPDDIQQSARRIVQAATTQGVMIATAESCTGGLIAAALTAIPGSSAVLDRGFVTYSNAAKVAMLGVCPDDIDAYGAVSAPVARAMAMGAAAACGAAVSVSVTGVAGPGGGSEEKPVGLVHFAAQGLRGLIDHHERFGDIGRDAVRMASVRVALRLLADRLSA